MAKCKCKYYLRDEEGKLVCSVCGKPAPDKPEIEDKNQTGHETKNNPLYMSDKDKAKAQTEALVQSEEDVVSIGQPSGKRKGAT